MNLAKKYGNVRLSENVRRRNMKFKRKKTDVIYKVPLLETYDIMIGPST